MFGLTLAWWVGLQSHDPPPEHAHVSFTAWNVLSDIHEEVGPKPQGCTPLGGNANGRVTMLAWGKSQKQPAGVGALVENDAEEPKDGMPTGHKETERILHRLVQRGRHKRQKTSKRTLLSGCKR